MTKKLVSGLAESTGDRIKSDCKIYFEENDDDKLDGGFYGKKQRL